MHQKNILVLGSNVFVSTLNELKPFLKFNPHTKASANNYDAIIFHIDALNIPQAKVIIEESKTPKICAQNQNNDNSSYLSYLQLPTTIREINLIVENVLAKKTYNKNSSIRLKNYLLDKNEKKLKKNNDFTVLTEKEIQLLELLINEKLPISPIDPALWPFMLAP